jgi:uncharacterized protein (TIGR02217 family)
MSSYLYPNNITGLSFGVVRSPEWNTGFQRALSGKQSTIAYQLYPFIHFELAYELLRDDVSTSDLKALVGLLNALQGRYDTFLFTDPDFNTITYGTGEGEFGVGDGSTLIFQLVAAFTNLGGPGYSEIIQNLNGIPVLYDNGTVISAANYSIGSTGIVTFGSGHAPVAGHTLAWSGSFYYRCRFDEDSFEWTKFMSQWWQSKVKFTSVIL